MPFLSGRLSSSRGRSVDVWAVGWRIVSAAARPVVFYKPKGGAWQLTYEGADVSILSLQFSGGYRRRADAAGKIYVVGTKQAEEGPEFVQRSVVGTSLDNGATWSYIERQETFGIGAFARRAIGVTASGNIVAQGNSTTDLILYGAGSLDRATWPGTLLGVGDFLCLDADDSPTGASVLMASTLANGLADSDILTSSDGGATWTESANFSLAQAGGTFARAKGTFFVSGGKTSGGGVPSGPPIIWRSTNLLDWDEINTGLSPLRANAVAARTANRLMIVDGSSSPSAYISRDAGLSWSSPETFDSKVKLVRRLGNRFFALAGGSSTGSEHIWSSSYGMTWKQETLPSISSGTLHILDIFGD